MDGTSLLIGLGNPGIKYALTRHNAGALLAERLSKKAIGTAKRVWSRERKFFSEMAEVRVGEGRLLLCKPQTFMNLSGQAVAAVCRFHQISPEKVLVVYDDADLPLGTLRLKPHGSSGGHHGVASIEEHLGTKLFPRLRLGIARPDQSVRDIADHVLGNFSDEELPRFNRVLDRAESQVRSWFFDGLQKAMNLYNGFAE